MTAAETLARNKAVTRAFYEGIWSEHRIEPLGAAFSFTQTTICRVVDGRITDVWEDFDYAGLLRQLGVVFSDPE